jgi:hypothetical protein
MAAGLGSKTFTTGEVLSAGDVNGYLMQGVLVFASAAARDAAITSPQEGQYAYLKDTDATVYYSGSAWVAAGSSGSLTSIASGSVPTGTTTLSLTSISGSYTHLQMVVFAWSGTGNNTVTCRLNNDTGANYAFSNTGFTTGSARASGLTGQTSFNLVSGDSAISGNNKNISVINIPFYTNATTGKTFNASTGFLDSTSARAQTTVNGYYSGTNAAVTQIDFIYGSNWTGGTYVLYGVK